MKKRIGKNQEKKNKPVYSSLNSFDLFRTFFFTDYLLSKNLYHQNGETDKKIISDLDLYNEIANIKGSLFHISRSWEVTPDEEKAAFNYREELHGTEFSIFEMADAANEFLKSYFCCHKKSSEFKKTIRFLDYFLASEDPPSREEISMVNQSIALCSSVYFERVKIGGDLMT